jgi:tetratricopeptide (TPR) repeat protein
LRRFALVFWLAVTGLPGTTAAQDSNLSFYAQRTLQEYYTGHYPEAEVLAERIVAAGLEDPNVMTALIKAELAQGKYREAASTAEKASRIFTGYFPVQVLAIEALRQGGREDKAKAILEELNQLAKKTNPKGLSAVEMVALGKAALLLGAEPKMVLSRFFQPARKVDPRNLDAPLAAAGLAIDHGDYALAAKILDEARSEIGPFPDLLHQLARAFSPSDRAKAAELLELACERNPNHVPSIILQAGHLIDAERHEAAREKLDRALTINPHHPRVWAYQAAMAHMRDDR